MSSYSSPDLTQVPDPEVIDEGLHPEVRQGPIDESGGGHGDKQASSVEPNYVGPNKRIDAMAVAWLFAQDYVFFNPDEITWDGMHHGIAGAQINLAKVGDIPTFMDNTQMYYQGIYELLMALEHDEALIVPREKIHPGLYPG